MEKAAQDKREALATKAMQRSSNRASQPDTSTAQSKTERLQEDTALIENKVAKAWLIMAKRASMEQDLRLRTAAMHCRLAEKKCPVDPKTRGGVRSGAGRKKRSNTDNDNVPAKRSCFNFSGNETLCLYVLNYVLENRQHIDFVKYKDPWLARDPRGLASSIEACRAHPKPTAEAGRN